MKRNETHYEKIADGLAEEGYAVIDEFLNLQEVDAILQQGDFANGTGQFRKAGTGQDRDIVSAVRGDYIEWIDRETAPESIMVYLRELKSLIAFLNQALFLSLKDFEVHKTIYPSGSRYKRHLDQFKADDHRRISVVCYLNKEWQDSDGGALTLYCQAGPVNIFPLAGRLVCFRSDQLEHEVLPATRDRLSLTGWILDQWSGLHHL